MAAGVYDIQVEQGATKRFNIVYQDSLGVPIDLTGYEVRGQVRARAQDLDPVAEIDCTVSDAAGGVVTIEIPAATSSAIHVPGKSYESTKSFYYDIEAFNVDESDVIRLLNGAFIISPEVTK